MIFLERKLRIAAEKLSTIPKFDSTALMTDDAVKAAEISSVFNRPGRYFCVLDGPRMDRNDLVNEVTRRRNSLAKSNVDRILIGGLSQRAKNAIIRGGGPFITAENTDDSIKALAGYIKRPAQSLPWGRTNLGVGLYLARCAQKQLICNLPESPLTTLVERGRHLLVACERGNELAEVTASNLAFSLNASFTTFAELPKEQSEQWIDELYLQGEKASAGNDVLSIAVRAKAHLSGIDVTPYGVVLWITNGFPWGFAIPEVPSSHLNCYPDFGRVVAESLWASLPPQSASRTALLIDPGTVGGAEMPLTNRALLENGTLTQVMRGSGATVVEVQSAVDLIPYDIVVLSSHAGDASGERLTFQYKDFDNKKRTLVIDEAVGAGFDRDQKKFQVTLFDRFHSLDGISWLDDAAKLRLPVGSAINAWEALAATGAHQKYITHREPIDRVNGSMGIGLYDGTWFFVSHGFPPATAPLIINNSCWSWHHISERAIFAGARGYLGTSRPILGVEAEQVSNGIFTKYLGLPLPIALWAAQRDAYHEHSRHPYIFVGLPCISIQPNKINPYHFLETSILDSLAYWSAIESNSPNSAENLDNRKRNSVYLTRRLADFRKNTIRKRPSPHQIPEAYK